jgi:cell division protein FtsL
MTAAEKAKRRSKKLCKPKRKPGPEPRAKRLTFGFLMLVLFILGCIGVFMVAMHQSAVGRDIETRRIEQEIASEKTKQKSMRVELARLRSPGRVARVAQEELDFQEPCTVIYLRYSSTSDGGVASIKTHAARDKESPEQGEKNQTSAEKESASELTRR